MTTQFDFLSPPVPPAEAAAPARIRRAAPARNPRAAPPDVPRREQLDLFTDAPPPRAARPDER